MLRGYQRKLIMIRTKESSIFESAFFILRGSSSTGAVSDEMVAEANRIIEECNLPRKKQKQITFKHILITAGISFLLGAVLVGSMWIMIAM